MLFSARWINTSGGTKDLIMIYERSHQHYLEIQLIVVILNVFLCAYQHLATLYGGRPKHRYQDTESNKEMEAQDVY